jgi:hypothetical protein
VRDFAIAVHATAAVAALLVGIWLLTRSRAGTVLWVYYASLVLMTLALVVAVAFDWDDTDNAGRAIFAALAVLALAMVGQAERARRVASQAAERRAFVDRVGFTLVALLVGFAVVTATDLDAPGWAVALIGVATVLAGRRGVHAARPRSDSAAHPSGRRGR